MGMVFRFRNGFTFWCMVFFYQYINGLVERYPELYSEENIGDISQHQINFGKKWGNYTAIVELANGNLNEIDLVVQQPLEKALLLLSYKADKSLLQDMILKSNNP